MHWGLLTDIVLKIAADLNASLLPAENGYVFSGVEKNRLANRQLAPENFTEPARMYENFDVALNIIYSKLKACVQSFVEHDVWHVDRRRMDLLISVHLINS